MKDFLVAACIVAAVAVSAVAKESPKRDLEDPRGIAFTLDNKLASSSEFDATFWKKQFDRVDIELKRLEEVVPGIRKKLGTYHLSLYKDPIPDNDPQNMDVEFFTDDFVFTHELFHRAQSEITGEAKRSILDSQPVPEATKAKIKNGDWRLAYGLGPAFNESMADTFAFAHYRNGSVRPLNELTPLTSENLSFEQSFRRIAKQYSNHPKRLGILNEAIKGMSKENLQSFDSHQVGMVLHGFLFNFGNQTRRMNIFKEWLNHVLAESKKPENFQILVCQGKGGEETTINLSLSACLRTFGEKLDGPSKKLFNQLRNEYRLTSNNIISLIEKRCHNLDDTPRYVPLVSRAEDPESKSH